MKLFEPACLGHLELKNRCIRSATNEYLGEDSGVVSDRLIDIYRELAENEVGLIITAHFAVSPDGRANPQMPIIQLPENRAPFKKMADIAHENGAKIIMQLNHAGPKAPAELSGKPPKGPSSAPPVEALTEAELQDIIDNFIASAKVAYETGFDGVQIHAAHGYLFSTFFDPTVNRREDAFGGPVENRISPVLQIIDGIREQCGERPFLLMTKINSNTANPADYRGDLLETALLLERRGIQCIELSGLDYPAFAKKEKAYYLRDALMLKESLTIPVALVGGLYTVEDAEDVLQQGIDFASFARALICEPDLIARFLKGRQAAAKCVRCNRCNSLLQSQGKRCVLQ